VRSDRRDEFPGGGTLEFGARAAVVKLVYTQASGACGLYARGGSSPLSRMVGGG
jgi:hypothetical protein